jgi:hypothetical protein
MTATIQFTSGCPHNCDFCYEKTKIECFEPIIPEDPDIQILDMNFLANPNAREILKSLPKRHWEFICGVDYRVLDQELCDLMKEKGFINIRWAWDYAFTKQRVQKHVKEMFTRAGYKSEVLSVFIITNWKIPFVECCQKLDLLKVWNVKVNDCCYDGGYKNAKPEFWMPEHNRKFRKMCRKHNQLVRFKIDPEY